jgi:hypothetical protein
MRDCYMILYIFFELVSWLPFFVLIIVLSILLSWYRISVAKIIQYLDLFMF